MHVSIALQKSNSRAHGGTLSHSVKFLYTSTMPLVLLSAMLSNVFIASQMLYSLSPRHGLVRMLGVWKPVAVNAGNQSSARHHLRQHHLPPPSPPFTPSTIVHLPPPYLVNLVGHV